MVIRSMEILKLLRTVVLPQRKKLWLQCIIKKAMEVLN